MKGLLLILILPILTACVDSNDSASGNLILDSNIDLTDLHGDWVNTCSENKDDENIYKRKFIKTSGDPSNNPSVVTIGFSNSDCSQLPPFAEGLVLARGSIIGISPYGIYITTEGLSAKVVELEPEFEGSFKMAFLVISNTLYFTFENNSEFNFNFDEPYTSNE